MLPIPNSSTDPNVCQLGTDGFLFAAAIGVAGVGPSVGLGLSALQLSSVKTREEVNSRVVALHSDVSTFPRLFHALSLC